MKKRIPYIVAFAWSVLVIIAAVINILSWNQEKAMSQYEDACIAGNKIYLTEAIEDDCVLYVMDDRGNVRAVTRASAYSKDRKLTQIAHHEQLYGVYEKEIVGVTSTSYEYQIVEFHDNGTVMKETPVLLTGQIGQLSGFSVNDSGFFLTLILEEGASAGVYVAEKELLAEKKGFDFSKTEEEPQPIEMKLLDITSAGEGRKVAAATYEEGRFLTWLDDGSGAEQFTRSREITAAFENRSLNAFQYIKIYRMDLFIYLIMLMAGYMAIVLLVVLLKNRHHTIYTIAVVEVVLFTITLVGAILIPRTQKEIRKEEAERYGFYYMETMVETMGDSNEIDGASKVFSDVYLVRTKDRQVISSTNDFLGVKIDELCPPQIRVALQELEYGNRHAVTEIKIDGQPQQVLGVAVTGGIDPEYVLLGVMDGSGTEEVYHKSQLRCLIYAEILFLIGSALSILLLLRQERELKHLAEGMKAVAGGEKELHKGNIHSKDIAGMWNSLMETSKIIERINYTKYQVFESCYRFAPKNIERILGKDSITEVKGGDNVYVDGTVAIISSDDMEDNGQITADMINRLISVLEKHREEKEGFFVSGQSNLSRLKLLFLEETKDTLQFGTSLIHELKDIGEVESLHASVLLHYSKYLYGIAGTEKQSFPFLISRELREIESFAKWFQRMGVRMVVTEDVKLREGSNNLRYIGYIRIPSQHNEKLAFYEVLDACPVNERRLKQETNAKFQAALKLLGQHDFYFARNMFNEVLKENPQDKMAKWYLFTCEKYLNETRLLGDVCALQRDTRFAENN